MHAIHKNQRGSVLALLHNGAAPNAVSTNGETALIMAAAYGQADIVSDLLDGGADATQSVKGSTALDAALTGANDVDRFTLGQCQTSTVKVLLEKAPRGLKASGGNADRMLRLLKRCSEIDRMLAGAQK